MIPPQLCDAQFCKIKFAEKKPIGLKWNVNTFSFNELNKYLTSNVSNYGVVCGFNNIIVIDFDNQELQKEVVPKLPETFTVKSGRGLLHKYFFTDKPESFKILNEKKETLADIQGQGKMVVGPGSTHSNGNIYEIYDDKPISFIPLDEIKALLMPYDKQQKKKEAPPTLPTTKDINVGSDMLDKIKNSISIGAVLKSLGVDTSINPTKCPMHSSVGGHCLGYNNGVAHCFSCEGAWNIFSIVRDVKKCSFAEAMDYLVGLVGLTNELRESRRKFIDQVYEAENKLNVVETPVETSPTYLKTMSILDYQNYKSNKHWIIKNRKYTNESELIVAPSRSFKSIMNQYQACCIATGKKYLDFPTKKSAVLYISAETSIEQDKYILLKILRGMGVRCTKNLNKNLFFLPRHECEDIMGAEFQSKLLQTITKHNIKVIYIDTINPVTPSIDDNSGRDVTRVYNDFIKKFCDKGINISMLCHTGKDEDKYLGSVKWFANVDNEDRFSRKDLQNVVSIYNEKCRTGERKVLDVELNFSGEVITIKKLAEREASVYNKSKKISQQDFFIMHLNNLCSKDMKRESIQDCFAMNDIKYSPATLDRAIKAWRKE